MEGLSAKLWRDDTGAVIAGEYIFAATILVIGIIVGVVSLRDGLNAEFAEYSNSILGLSQAYSISGYSGCSSSTDGSQALDTPGTVANPTYTAPGSPATIDVPIP
jgi:hypothetical protein